ncbi:NAD-dependent epimerase/dehydratase family protein [Agrobacterium sp. lyk4-40-TYG-31]|uniref:NAD-dependent epimerase/dehydratase family protein n=1 Tax=Agrobacterium sp. lyk4-40-TYG-31 TaxID=3040276 RepID=UPI00254B3FD1|nr:NAD-dependent epimerase/dehydratase family protein [Agrobacterium sp. lyk4-40-TYG-31]
MRVLVTGADGFLGRGLVQALAPAFPDAKRLVLTDRAFAQPAPPGAETIIGDLGDADFLENLLEPGFDLVFHLASIPGGLAEQEQELGHRSNLLASLALASSVAARRPGARFVFASSIAVYGDLGKDTVTPRTQPAPLLTYGAHKLMMEIMLSDLSRQKALSAISLRFPGIVARPPSESGHGSAFMSHIFHKIAAGEAYECPIPATSTCWWMSRRAATGILLHAARLSGSDHTVIQPPVNHASLQEMAEAIARVIGKAARIGWQSDEKLQRVFGAMPPLDDTAARTLSFCTDVDLETLARTVLSGDE